MTTVHPIFVYPDDDFQFINDSAPWRCFQIDEFDNRAAKVTVLVLNPEAIDFDLFGINLSFVSAPYVVGQPFPSTGTPTVVLSGDVAIVTLTISGLPDPPLTHYAKLTPTMNGMAVDDFKNCPITVARYHPNNDDEYAYITGFCHAPLVVSCPADVAKALLTEPATYQIEPSTASPLLHGVGNSYDDATSDLKFFYPLVATSATANTLHLRNLGTEAIILQSVRVGGNAAGALKNNEGISLLPGQSTSLELADILVAEDSDGVSLNLTPVEDPNPSLPEMASTDIKFYAETAGSVNAPNAQVTPACTLRIQQKIGHAELTFVIDMSGSMNSGSRIGSVLTIWQSLIARFKSAYKVDAMSATHARLVLVSKGRVWCRYPAQAGAKEADLEEQFQQENLNNSAGTEQSACLRYIHENLDMTGPNDVEGQMKHAIRLIFGKESSDLTLLDQPCTGASPIGEGVLRALSPSNDLNAVQTRLFEGHQNAGAPFQNRRLLVLFSDGGENAGAWRFLGDDFTANIAALLGWLTEQRVTMVPVSYTPFNGMWDALLAAGEESDNPEHFDPFEPFVSPPVFDPIHPNDHPLIDFLWPEPA